MKSKYAMSESQVEALAADYASASAETMRVNTTYLRVVVVAMQAILGNKKRGRVPVAAQTEVLNDVTDKYYAAVLRGITTPDLAPDGELEQAERSRRARERNRRSTFARTAKTVLAAYIRSGHDVRTLDADTVTRDPLAAAVRATRGVSEATHGIERHRNALVRLAMAEAKDDPDKARADIEASIEALQFALDGISPNGNQAEPRLDPGTITAVLAGRPMHTRQPAPRGRAHA